MEAKKLTENCYLISDQYNNRLGLTFKVGDKVLFTYDLEVYDSIEEIARKQNEKVIYTEIASEEKSNKDIEGYPIRHDEFYEVSEQDFNGDTIITYKSREGSTVEFCAGWWVISTDSQLRVTLSPKLSTLSNNCYGPFKNKFDCQAELNRIKNAI